jgi:hypothetical protein
MNALDVMEKWAEQIERCQVGDEANIRPLVSAGLAELGRTPCSFWELAEASCKLWAIAEIQVEPGLTAADIEAGWGVMVHELHRSNRLKCG